VERIFWIAAPQAARNDGIANFELFHHYIPCDDRNTILSYLQDGYLYLWIAALTSSARNDEKQAFFLTV
jgi:hypothetical protein